VQRSLVSAPFRRLADHGLIYHSSVSEMDVLINRKWAPNHGAFGQVRVGLNGFKMSWLRKRPLSYGLRGLMSFSVYRLFGDEVLLLDNATFPTEQRSTNSRAAMQTAQRFRRPQSGRQT
jgi:hypothetical protein